MLGARQPLDQARVRARHHAQHRRTGDLRNARDESRLIAEDEQSRAADGPERSCRSGAVSDDDALPVQLPRQLSGQAGPPRPWRAADDYDRAGALPRAIPRLAQPHQLARPTEHRRRDPELTFDGVLDGIEVGRGEHHLPDAREQHVRTVASDVVQEAGRQ